MDKSAQQSIGVLIIFISALFVTAITAGVLITTSGSFQSSALSTGREVTSEATSGFRFMDISASDGRDGTVNHFRHLLKLHPGASALNLEYATITIGTQDVTSSLNYRGAHGIIENNNQGYNTFLPEELGETGQYNQLITTLINDLAYTALSIDLDFDGLPDNIIVCNDARPLACTNGYGRSHVGIYLSTGPIIHIPLYNQDGNLIDLQIKDGELFSNILTPIGDYGYLSASGSEMGSGGYSIPANRIRIFQQPIILREDIDDDGVDDWIVVNQTHLVAFLSSRGNITAQYNDRTGLSFPLGINLSTGPQTLDEITITITDAETTFATALINGTTTRASYIDEEVTFRITPHQLYRGYFAAEYVQRGPSNKAGILSQGDVIRLYYETPRPIREDEQLRITMMPRSGGFTYSEFYMPHIIAEEVIHLYP